MSWEIWGSVIQLFEAAWVASIHDFLLQFREQVVKETVEQLEQKLYEKLVHHNQAPDFPESSVTAAPPASETQTGNENQCDWLISCCNCQARIVGVRYQCR